MLTAIPPPAALCESFKLGYYSFASVFDVVNSITAFVSFVKGKVEKRERFFDGNIVLMTVL